MYQIVESDVWASWSLDFQEFQGRSGYKYGRNLENPEYFWESPKNQCEKKKAHADARAATKYNPARIVPARPRVTIQTTH
jgi:hypothetical protein